jgi:hypothetical protein
MIAQPLLEVTGDTTLVIDAPAAQPVSLTVPAPTADLAIEQVIALVPGGSTGIATFGDDEGSLHTLHLGPTLPPSDYATAVQAMWAEQGPADNWLPFADSPFSYNLAYVAARGQFIIGFTRHPGPDDLAHVRQDYAAQGPGFTGDSHSRQRMRTCRSVAVEAENVERRDADIAPSRLRQRGDPRPESDPIYSLDPFRLQHARSRHAVIRGEFDLPGESTDLCGQGDDRDE